MEWNSFSYRGNQKITLTEQGFIRSRKSSLETEVFNLDGKLIKYDLGNGVFNIIEYLDTKISKLTTGDGTTLHFKVNEDGFVTEIKLGENSAVYKYDNKNLIYNQDIAGNSYGFEYDEKHNLTKIIYNITRFIGVEEDSQNMTYHQKTSFIKSITTRDGDITSYEYPTFYKNDGTVDPQHYATYVTKAGYNGKMVTNKYEYFTTTKPNGDSYTSKTITEVNNRTTITKIDEFCEERPIEITKGSNTTTFKYNNRCLLIEKLSASGDSIYMKYHPTSEKITYIKNNESTHEFTYDDNLNLIYAVKDKDKWVKLVYNEDNKITSMEDKERTLTFEYNKIGKPIKIDLKSVGTINVVYDNYGEIKRVESEAGHKMALQVTQAFQNLLQLVKPSGVNLGM